MDKQSAWEGFKKFMWTYIGGLVMEPKGPNGEMAMSIGRVLLLTVFGILLWSWLFKESAASGQVVLPPHLLQIFFALASYVLGGKFVDALKLKLGQRKKE